MGSNASIMLQQEDLQNICQQTGGSILPFPKITLTDQRLPSHRIHWQTSATPVQPLQNLGQT